MNSLLFGAMSTLVLKVLHPLVASLLNAIPRTVSYPLAGGLFVYFILDGTVTTFGILRMNGKLVVLPMEEERVKAKKPSVLQKLNQLKSDETRTAPKKAHSKEER